MVSLTLRSHDVFPTCFFFSFPPLRSPRLDTTRKAAASKDSRHTALAAASYTRSTRRELRWFDRDRPRSRFLQVLYFSHVKVSLNGGTQQPWVFLLKMIILGCFGGTTVSGNTYVCLRGFVVYRESFIVLR